MKAHVTIAIVTAFALGQASVIVMLLVARTRLRGPWRPRRKEAVPRAPLAPVVQLAVVRQEPKRRQVVQQAQGGQP
jgi:hypothetical protein